MSAVLRWILGALVGALLHGAGLAQTPASSCPPTAGEPTSAQLQAGAAAARDRGFLWRLRRDGRESWLYGTVHVARFEWMFPGPLIMTALTASDTIALELDVLDPDIQQRMAQGMAAARATPLPGPLQRRL